MLGLNQFMLLKEPMVIQRFYEPHIFYGTQLHVFYTCKYMCQCIMHIFVLHIEIGKKVGDILKATFSKAFPSLKSLVNWLKSNCKSAPRGPISNWRALFGLQHGGPDWRQTIIWIKDNPFRHTAWLGQRGLVLLMLYMDTDYISNFFRSS